MWERLAPAAYLLVIYGLSRLVGKLGNTRQAVVVDTLMFNWFACEMANQLIVQTSDLPGAYLIVDSTSALWLSVRIEGVCSAFAEFLYIAMILYNTAQYYGHVFPEKFYWRGLSVLSWVQVIGVFGGIVRGGLVEAVGRLSARIGLLRHVAIRHEEVEERLE